MKKLTLLLFIAGLFVISFTNTNCTRPKSPITPISGGDTQKTGTKIDSSGEDIHITVTQGVTTTNALVAAGAKVYLFDNFLDYQNYSSSNGANHSSKYIDSTTAGGDGTCTIHVPARNCTGRYFPSSAGIAYAKQAYNYYCAAKWKDDKSKINTGWYSTDGSCKDAAVFTVAINNGLNKAGLSVPIAVSYP